MCPLHVCRGGKGQSTVIKLKVMSNTFKKVITHTAVWQLDSSHFHRKRVGIGSRRGISILLGVSSTKRCGSAIIDLDGWWKLFYSVLIQACLIKHVQKLSQVCCQTAC